MNIVDHNFRDGDIIVFTGGCQIKENCSLYPDDNLSLEEVKKLLIEKLPSSIIYKFELIKEPPPQSNNTSVGCSSSSSTVNDEDKKRQRESTSEADEHQAKKFKRFEFCLFLILFVAVMMKFSNWRVNHKSYKQKLRKRKKCYKR